MRRLQAHADRDGRACVLCIAEMDGGACINLESMERAKGALALAGRLSIPRLLLVRRVPKTIGVDDLTFKFL